MLQWRIGAVTVSRVVELDGIRGMYRILPDAVPEELAPISWLSPDYVEPDGSMKASIHALVVETPDRRLIVDTCVGNHKPRPVRAWNMLDTTFLADLTEAGFAPDSIDTVMCTHLHLDHVGWNTRLEDGRWVPTFARARYLMAQTEYDHWMAEDQELQNRVMTDSVRPIFDAGLAELVAMDHRPCAEISLLPTVGHTPGHVSVLIESQGESALITGDFIHHPCQFARPEWSAAVDTDPAQAETTRRAIFERFVDTPTLIIGTHFSAPTAGRLVRDGDAYRLDG